MHNIHFPDSFESYSIARRRFVFEELLILQLALFNRKRDDAQYRGAVFKNLKAVREFTDTLPFPLTGAQKRTLNEICSDVRSGKMMNRLVQGDVGSGKTAVAAAAIYLAVKNGFQAAMMAPTEILASQHFETLEGYFKDMGIKTMLLTGRQRSGGKRWRSSQTAKRIL